MLNLRGVDLNLLPVFEAVYEERSLSRAAARLAMTQPAVSHALTRLRSVFEDALFIRHDAWRGAHARRRRHLRRSSRRARAVRDAVIEARGFDPKTSRRNFFVAIPHPLGPLMAVRLRQRLAVAATECEGRVQHALAADRARARLQDGRVDVAVD